MPKLSELKTASQIAAAELADPEIGREHERTALAHAVAMRVIGYRIDDGLSQTGLARLLGSPAAASWTSSRLLGLDRVSVAKAVSLGIAQRTSWRSSRRHSAAAAVVSATRGIRKPRRPRGELLDDRF
jgi:2-methylcitrate dehydratase PrpD